MDHQALTPRPDLDSRKVVEDFYGYLAILWRGWRYPAVLSAIALVLAMIYVARLRPTYDASARLLVLQQGGQPLNVASNHVANNGDLFQSVDGYSNSLSTHVMILRSPLIVEQALALSGLKGVSTATVISRLKVNLPDSSARVLELEYRSESRDEAVRVVDAVIRSYDDFLKKNYQRNSDDVIALIVKARDELSTDLRKLEQEYLEFRQKSPTPGGKGEGPTFITRRLDQWDQAIHQATVRELQLKQQLELGRQLSEEGAGAATVASALNQLNGLEGNARVTANVADGGGGGSSPGLSPERIEAELADVEFRRRTAEELVVQLRAEQAAEGGNPPVRDEDVAQAFHAEPPAAALSAELSKARAKLEQTRRVTRQPSDPSVLAITRRIKELEKEIGQLWQRRVPAIRAELAQVREDPVRAQAETELRSLRAREASLRKQSEEFRSARLTQLRKERDDLIARLGPKHERVRAVEGQLERLGEPLEEAAMGTVQPQARALVQAIERGLKSVEAMRAEIEQRFRRDLEESRKSEIDLLAETNLRNNLERQRMLFHSVVDQLKQAQLVSDFGSVTARVLNPPAASENRARSSSILCVALVLGLGLGGGLAFLADLMDARLRSLSEIRKVLELKVLGLVPETAATQLNKDFSVGLISHLLPRSLMAEAYKAVRTSLDLLRRNVGAQVLLVTSPQPGDGKSTTISNLAITLAHAGRRVLLIDADLRRPTQHQIHELNRSPGLTHILKDVLPLHRVVQRTPIDNLDFLAAGPEVANPAELLSSVRLSTLIEEARRCYDVVLLDSSPMLAVTDPSILASVVDGIVLIIRLSATRRHDLEETQELFRTLGTPLMGAVINGMIQEPFGYGYGSGYGYVYGVYGTSETRSAGAATGLKALARLTSTRNAADPPEFEMADQDANGRVTID
jgi:capsular exopolysaccharide synthesis family protein